MAQSEATAAAVEVVTADLVGDEAGEAPSAAEEAAAEEVQQEAAEAPDLEPEVPEDIKAFLEEPDFDAEAEAEVAAEVAQQESEDEETYEETSFEDPQLARERKARIKAEKKATWLEQQRIRESKGKWESEALKYFPHCEPFLPRIEATSRRGFLRAASAYHETIKAHVQKVAPGNTDSDRERLKAEIRAELEEAWGKPTTGPGQVPIEASDAQQKWERARQSGDQVGMVKARNFHRLLG